jgi:hypothetical protein
MSTPRKKTFTTLAIPVADGQVSAWPWGRVLGPLPGP